MFSRYSLYFWVAFSLLGDAGCTGTMTLGPDSGSDAGTSSVPSDASEQRDSGDDATDVQALCASKGGFCTGGGPFDCAEEPAVCSWEPPGPQSVCCVPKRCAMDAGTCRGYGTTCNTVDASTDGAADCIYGPCCLE
jgi:hypothetical protein